MLCVRAWLLSLLLSSEFDPMCCAVLTAAENGPFKSDTLKGIPVIEFCGERTLGKSVCATPESARGQKKALP